ncbi:MAG: nitronate monooxygenase, partial [Solirubrobacteraceae bacterium]|nr:nitronate monooxygenase [Solirubrobacteraceae bacterium]
MDLAARLGLEHPVVQAGMGGGLALTELAAAVSNAGGLGTVGILPDPLAFAAQLRQAGALTEGRPLAANLLLPFARRAHFEACVEAGVDAVVLFCGSAPEGVARLRRAGILVLAQVGTPDQARQALADGADGLIAQGEEAGGHLLGVEPTLAFLARALALADGRPVLAAGGIASRDAAAAALAAGAAAVVCGTRFLLTHECGAHPAYKQRVLGAPRTLDTLLFSVGWSDRHRVVPNAATDRWCARSERGPAAVVAVNRLLAPALQRLPPRLATATLSRQRVGVPLFGPAAPLAGMDERLVEVAPLY